jgi:hypothetical protein
MQPRISRLSRRWWLRWEASHLLGGGLNKELQKEVRMETFNTTKWTSKQGITKVWKEISLKWVKLG